jgi:hypothetical protein
VQLFEVLVQVVFLIRMAHGDQAWQHKHSQESGGN